MADLTSLVAGGAKSLLQDKAAGFLSPSQMELARFALSPQAYLADKGISAVANLLGYGDQYKDLRAGAQAEKDYYKETMRDALGNLLPNAIGDVVRSTPKGNQAAYDSSMEALRQSANTPEAIAQFNAGFNPDSQYNIGSQNYVGPQDPRSMDSNVYGDNVKALYEMLGQYQQPSGANTRSLSSQPSDTQAGPGYRFDPTTGTAVPMQDETYGQVMPGYQFDPNTETAIPIDFGGTMDYGDMFGGGGGGKSGLDIQTQANAMAHGGQVCGCKR